MNQYLNYVRFLNNAKTQTTTPKTKTMTAEQKARELVEKYLEFTEEPYADMRYNAKQCALICVDEILRSGLTDEYSANLFWEQVKTELEKLK